MPGLQLVEGREYPEARWRLMAGNPTRPARLVARSVARTEGALKVEGLDPGAARAPAIALDLVLRQAGLDQLNCTVLPDPAAEVQPADRQFRAVRAAAVLVPAEGSSGGWRIIGAEIEPHARLLRDGLA